MTQTKDRWAAGVTPYAEMGYYNPDYEPKDSDILAAFRVTPQPGALRQDVPGPAPRHRHGARVPGQVRAPAARRHGQAEARPVRQELRPRRLRGAPRRPGLHQGRREHQLAAVHALARSVPLRDGGGEPGDRRERGDQGP